jgi:hypothetical protein
VEAVSLLLPVFDDIPSHKREETALNCYRRHHSCRFTRSNCWGCPAHGVACHGEGTNLDGTSISRLEVYAPTVMANALVVANPSWGLFVPIEGANGRIAAAAKATTTALLVPIGLGEMSEG